MQAGRNRPFDQLLEHRLADCADWPRSENIEWSRNRASDGSRTWFIQDLFHGMDTIETVADCNRLCRNSFCYAPVWRYIGDIHQDFWHYYSRDTLLCLSVSVGAAAILANTSLDQQFRDWFQDHAATPDSDWVFAKRMGEVWSIPLFLFTVWAIDECVALSGCVSGPLENIGIGDWSRQSLRALLLGAPVVGILQVLTGASRPGEAAHGSKWRPFEDNNGVSGHAFVGAVPFLVAATRTERRLLKAALLIGSGLTGYSRINDDAHYLSQVLLGWSIAYLAAEATSWTETSRLQYRIVPLTLDGLLGVGMEMRY